MLNRCHFAPKKHFVVSGTIIIMRTHLWLWRISRSYSRTHTTKRQQKHNYENASQFPQTHVLPIWMEANFCSSFFFCSPLLCPLQCISYGKSLFCMWNCEKYAYLPLLSHISFFYLWTLRKALYFVEYYWQ